MASSSTRGIASATRERTEGKLAGFPSAGLGSRAKFLGKCMHASLSFNDGHLVVSLLDWWISELPDTQGLVVAHGLQILLTSGMPVQYN